MKKEIKNTLLAAILVAGLGITSCAGNKTETETETMDTTIDTVSTGTTGEDTDMNMAPTEVDNDTLTGNGSNANPVAP